jgi:hypothetical protein
MGQTFFFEMFSITCFHKVSKGFSDSLIQLKFLP